MNEKIWEDKLLKRIEFIGHRRGKMDREEFIEFVLYEIGAAGGDATVELIEHYKRNLDNEVKRLITE